MGHKQYRTMKPKGIFLLLSIYSVVIATSGHNVGFVVIADTNNHAATSTTSPTKTCDADQPNINCNDPSDIDVVDNTNNASGEKGDTIHDHDATVEDQRRTNIISKDSTLHPTSSTKSLRTKFKTGDIIELYNPDSKDIQIVFPSIVKGVESDGGGGYRIAKTTDGKEVKNVSEKYLHMYTPYSIGDNALCNIGEFSNKANENRPIIVQCTIMNYELAAERGAMVLQGKYQVTIHKTKVNEEYETELPVWKLQRRYLGDGNDAEEEADTKTATAA